jgi:hypothetical protein
LGDCLATADEAKEQLALIFGFNESELPLRTIPQDSADAQRRLGVLLASSIRYGHSNSSRPLGIADKREGHPLSRNDISKGNGLILSVKEYVLFVAASGSQKATLLIVEVFGDYAKVAIHACSLSFLFGS